MSAPENPGGPEVSHTGMRVILVSSMYPSAADPALGLFVKRQVQTLRELGVEVALAVTNRPGRRAVVRKYLRLGLDVLRRCARPFDLVHVHWPVMPGLLGWFAARLRRSPLVATVHGAEIDPDLVYALELGWPRRSLTRAIAGWVLRRADRVIVVGAYLVPVAESMGVRTERIAVINMGVDTGHFRPRPRHEARERLGLPLEATILVAVGSLTPVKGHRYAIEALRTIVRGHPSCVLYLVGAGNLEPELRRRTGELGLGDHVVLAGARPGDEIAWWMAAADALIMPSLTESFGLAALEALACGLPVVASRVGGLVDQITDGVNGYLVPPRDPAAIAAAVERILGDSAGHEGMRARCVDSARRHDARAQARRVVELYAGLTGERR
jgi:glycosyltransferase involved in cell wall biosynthesis